MKVHGAPEVRGTFGDGTVAALCCAVAVFCFALLPPRAGAAQLQPWSTGGQSAFALPDAAGATIALESARGHVVLVHFFATWCEPCRDELPALNRLATRSNGTVKVLAIAVADADRSVQRFLETTPLGFPVLLDRDRTVAKAWNAVSLPTTFVLDGNLHPTFVVETDYAWDTIDPATLVGSLAGAAAATRNTNNRNSGG